MAEELAPPPPPDYDDPDFLAEPSVSSYIEDSFAEPTEDIVQRWRDYFISADQDDDGQVTPKELVDLRRRQAEALEHDFDEAHETKEVAAYFEQADSNGDDRISFEEFLTFAVRTRAPVPPPVYSKHAWSDDDIAAYRELFNAIDGDGDGYITMDELLDTRSADSRIQHEDFLGTRERGALVRFLQLADIDGDNRIDFNEFLAAVGEQQKDIIVQQQQQGPSVDDPLDAAARERRRRSSGKLALDSMTALAKQISAKDQELAKLTQSSTVGSDLDNEQVLSEASRQQGDTTVDVKHEEDAPIIPTPDGTTLGNPLYETPRGDASRENISIMETKFNDVNDQAWIDKKDKVIAVDDEDVRQRLRILFDRLDLNGNGFIEPNELFNTQTQVLVERGEFLSEDEIRSRVVQFNGKDVSEDADENSEFMSFDSFVDVMEKQLLITHDELFGNSDVILWNRMMGVNPHPLRRRRGSRDNSVTEIDIGMHIDLRSIRHQTMKLLSEHELGQPSAKEEHLMSLLKRSITVGANAFGQLANQKLQQMDHQRRTRDAERRMSTGMRESRFRISELDNELAEAREQIATLENDVQNHITTEQNLNNNIIEINQTIADMEQDKKAQDTVRNSLEKGLEEARAALKLYQEKFTTQESESVQVKNSRNALQAEYDRLKTSLDTTNGKLQELNTEFTDTSSRLSQLQTEYKSQVDMAKTLEQEKEQETTHKLSLQKSMHELQAKNSELEGRTCNNDSCSIM
jgi:Ca2+-binding EF-hand superfamily protein